MNKFTQTEKKVLHGLVADDPVYIHEFLDIELTKCIDACRLFRSLKTNFQDQLMIWPTRRENLSLELEKVERQIISSLIFQAQNHELSEKDSKKHLAFPDYPYTLTSSRDCPHNIFGHE